MKLIETTTQNVEMTTNEKKEDLAKKYKKFSIPTQQNIFLEANTKYRGIAYIEKNSEEINKTWFSDLKEKKIFNRTSDVVWICKHCGHVHIGADAPNSCPVCSHPQSSFEIQNTAN